MHPVLFYLGATLTLVSVSSVFLVIINKTYSKKNFYGPEDIIKSASDSNEYTLFTLPNQMKVMIITSNHTELSAASLRISTGSLSDPVEFQGLAHFVEHILLLGSEKFPQEDLYRKSLAMNAGFGTASTSDVETYFGFQVIFRDLLGFKTLRFQLPSIYFLDFSLILYLILTVQIEKSNQCIVSGRTLSPAKVYQHVQLERKFMFILRLLSKKGHPFGKFPLGNLKSLIEDPKQRDLTPTLALRKFYRSEYSANRMSLVIFTHQRMRQRVTSLAFEYFQQITNKQLKDLNFTAFGLPLEPKNFVRLHTDSRDKEFVIFFNLDARGNIQTRMIQFVTYMLMNFFEVNFCFEMLNKFKIYDCSHQWNEIPNEFGFFMISMKISRETYAAEILKSLFSRINLLKTLDFHVFEDYFELLREIQYIKFDYKDDPSLTAYVKQHAWKIYHYFGKRALVESEINQQFDKAQLKSILYQLNASNINFIFRYNFTFASKEEVAYITPTQLQEQLGEEGKLERSDDLGLLDMQEPRQKIERVRVKQKVKKIKEKWRRDEGEEETPKERKEFQKQDLRRIDDYGNSEPEFQEEEETTYEEEETMPIDHSQLDFSLDKLDELVKVPFSNFKYSYTYGLHYLTSKIANKTSKILEASVMKHQLQEPDVVRQFLPKVYETIPQIQYKNQRQYKKQIFRYPELLESSPQGNMWWLKDVSLRVPKVSVRISVRYLNYNKMDVQTAYSILAIQILKLKWSVNMGLERYKLLALEKFDVSYASLGTFEISYYCYSDKVHQITEEIFKLVQKSQVNDQEELDWLINMVQIEQADSDQKVLYDQGIRYLKFLLSGSPAYSPVDYSNVRLYDDFKKYFVELVSTQRWDVLLYGDIEVTKARQLWHKYIKPYQDSLPAIEIHKNEMPSLNILKLMKHPITFRTRFPSYDMVNVVTINYYQGSERNIVQYTFMKLIQPQLQSYAFDYLRTQLQLGYIVQCQIVTVGMVDGIAIIVQSPNYDPEEIDFYIEECLGYFENFLLKLTDKEFQMLIDSLRKELQQVPLDLQSQTDLVWNPIKQGDYQFTLRECMVQRLDKIIKQDLQKFFQVFFKTRNSKLSLQLYNSHLQTHIPTEVLREQDTFSRTRSKFIGSEQDLKKEFNDFYKYSHRYITEAPDYNC